MTDATKTTLLSLCLRLIDETSNIHRISADFPKEQAVAQTCIHSSLGHMIEAWSLMLSDLSELKNDSWYDFGDAPESIDEAISNLPSFLDTAQDLLHEEMSSQRGTCPFTTVQMRAFTYAAIFKIAGEDETDL